MVGVQGTLSTDADRQTLVQQIDQALQTLIAAGNSKSQGRYLFWSEPTALIYNKFRAFDPWPGVFTGDLKLIDLRPARGSETPGRILSIDHNGVTLATGDGAITLITLQRAGRVRMPAAEFARGAGWRVGTSPK